MPPAERMPAVIEVHGGGWQVGERAVGRGLLMPLQGFFYASIDYRMSHQALFPAQIHDVKAAIRWLRAHADEYRVDPNRIGLWGGSAGGHLVTLAGASGDVPEEDWRWMYEPDSPVERLFGGAVHTRQAQG
jgi:acetyl esterase/lipase